jgi:UDP-N-acetylmuramate dehydrogenase
MREFSHHRLDTYSTFRLPSTARRIIECEDESELHTCLSDNTLTDTLIVGGGSNTLFAKPVVDAVIIRPCLMGIETLSREVSQVIVRVGAGESWHSFVIWSVAQGLQGIEALAGIPGSTGASPIQNIGAYGQEASDTIIAVEVYDRMHKVCVTYIREVCEFSYRTSIFKSHPHLIIVTRVIFRLVPAISETYTPPSYPSLDTYLATHGIVCRSPKELAHAVVAVRATRLPDPEHIPNVGSYFHNPIILHDDYQALQTRYPNIPGYRVDDRSIKVPAGWLIEHAGLKGMCWGSICSYEHNALVMIHDTSKDTAGSNCFDDLVRAETAIVTEIYRLFGITLKREPTLIV